MLVFCPMDLREASHLSCIRLNFGPVDHRRTLGLKSLLNLFPAGFEPATLRVWSARDSHYTTETWDVVGIIEKGRVIQGPVAQRITRLTTDQKIAGSNPAWVEVAVFVKVKKEKFLKKVPPPGGLEPPTFRLTAERASRLRHGGLLVLGASEDPRSECF